MPSGGDVPKSIARLSRSRSKREIFLHMLKCTTQVESANHIVETLSKFNHTTVLQSISELKRDKYIRGEQWRAQHSATHLLLTDKGVAAAILLGAHKGEYTKLHIYRNNRNTNPFNADFYIFEKMMTKAKGKDFLIRVYCHYLIVNNCFDKSGKEMVLTSEIRGREVQNFVAIEAVKKWGRPGMSPQEFVQALVEECGVDPTYVIRELSEIGYLAAPLRSAEQPRRDHTLKQGADVEKNDEVGTI